MRALVTGGGGFLGSYLCRALLNSGYDVISVDSQKRPHFPPELAKISWIQKDLSVEMFTANELKGVDTLFHLAAMLRSTDPAREANQLIQNEVIAINVFGSAVGRVERIVHASTQMVYGDPNSMSVNEDCSLGANITAYGMSKLNCENWLSYFQNKSGMNVIILRFTSFVEGNDSLVSNLIDSALDNKPIELFSMGEIYRDYLAVTDSIQAFLAAANIPFKKNNRGISIYNIGSGESIRTIDIAKCICSEIGSLSRIVPVSTQAPRSNFVYDISRARSELRFNPMPLLSAVKTYVKEKCSND